MSYLTVRIGKGIVLNVMASRNGSPHVGGLAQMTFLPHQSPHLEGRRPPGGCYAHPLTGVGYTHPNWGHSQRPSHCQNAQTNGGAVLPSVQDHPQPLPHPKELLMARYPLPAAPRSPRSPWAAARNAARIASWAETARLHAAFHIWIPRHCSYCARAGEAAGGECSPAVGDEWDFSPDPDPLADPVYLMVARAQLPQGSPWCVVLSRGSRLADRAEYHLAALWGATAFGARLMST